MKRRPHRTLSVVFGLSLLMAAWPVAARSDRRPSLPATRTVQVRAGDSLWTLARKYGDPQQDVREIVQRLGEANQVEAGELQPGTWLRIPADCLPSPGA